MGRKTALPGYKLATAESLAADFETAAVTVLTMDNVGINIATSGVTDNTGTFAVEHRIYKDEQNYSAWAELTLSPAPSLASADDVLFINLNQLPPGQIRVTFTAAGGTPDGTCDVWVSGCAVGG